MVSSHGPGGAGDDGAPAEPSPPVCARCGAAADAGAQGPPPTWTFSVEHGVGRHYCDTCSRENLRSIEGRLDSDWW
ncbi:hypothetical protein ACFY3O_35110 [Streptomyces sp. NPDC001046]|uniref:hypothetical protein n=1 Tax=unclassified Streptomyces TaxID=2593676 RepID=UPI0035D8D352